MSDTESDTESGNDDVDDKDSATATISERDESPRISFQFDITACDEFEIPTTADKLADFEEGTSAGVLANSYGFFYYERHYHSRTVALEKNATFSAIRAVEGTCSDNIIPFVHRTPSGNIEGWPVVAGLRLFLSLDVGGNPESVDLSKYKSVVIWYLATQEANLDFSIADSATYPGRDQEPHAGKFGTAWGMAWLHRVHLTPLAPPGWQKVEIPFSKLIKANNVSGDTPNLSEVYSIQLEFEGSPGEFYFDDMYLVSDK